MYMSATEQSSADLDSGTHDVLGADGSVLSCKYVDGKGSGQVDRMLFKKAVFNTELGVAQPLRHMRPLSK